MPFSQQPTIGTTLARLSALSIVTALVTAAVAFALYDRASFRDSLERRLGWQAEMVAANSASALVFDDPMAAATTVTALRAVPGVVRAAIYGADGSKFAEYFRADAAAPPARVPAPAAAGARPEWLGDRVRLIRPIVVRDKTVGAVTIEADLTELAAREWAYGGMSLVILVLSLGLAMLLSWRSQHTIVRPLSDLAAVASGIAASQDYSRRAAIRAGVREISVLTRAFNEMVERVDARDRSLREAHDVLETRVRDRTAELETVNRELEAFSYSVSHDLRAPLRHVSGFAEMLSDHAGPQLDDQARKYVATITSSARRMATLIDDLLGFSRVSRATLSRQRVSLSRAIADARRDVLLDETAAARDIDWVVAPALPDVDADPALLHQVFVNLLANAIKYTSRCPRARIEIGTGDGAAGEAVVFVRDNGVGFDMQYVDKLFGVFQRLHRASEFEGTGIGLANIKRIVVRHGGRVWATGAVNQGATFYVALPRAKDAAS